MNYMWVVNAKADLDLEGPQPGLLAGDVVFLVASSRAGFFLSAMADAVATDARGEAARVDLLWDWSIPVGDPIPLPRELVPQHRLQNGSVKLHLPDNVSHQLRAIWDEDEWVENSKAMEGPPKNAWLLIGDQASLDVLDQAPDDFFFPDADHFWTAPKQVQPGDLLLFYFMAPHKQIRFVGRAGSFPFFSHHIPVLGEHAGPTHWWVYYSRVQPLQDPIPLQELRVLFDNHLILRGGPTYLPPRVVEGLLPWFDDDVIDLSGVAIPTGLDDVPAPSKMSLDQWSRVASGALTLERHVEDYLVDPLLRLAFARHREVTWTRQHRITGAGVVDYSVSMGGTVRSVVEVKLGVRFRARDDSQGSPDFDQLLRYAHKLDVPGLLMDANRLFLFRRGDHVPHTVLDRAECNKKDLARVAAHLTGEKD